MTFKIKHIILWIGLILISSSQGFSQGVKLVSKTMSECQGYAFEEHYTNIQVLDSGLVSIDFMLEGNCGMSDKITFEFTHDTLYLVYNYDYIRIDTTWNQEPYKEPEFFEVDSISGDSIFQLFDNWEYEIFESKTWCDCCFCFNLVFSGLDTTNLSVTGKQGDLLPYFPEGFRVVPVTFEVLEGDTINYSDCYGRRQGKWVKNDIWDNTKTISNHINSECINSTKYHYREDGSLEKKIEFEGWYKTKLILKYDLSGNEISREEINPAEFRIND